MTAETNLEVTMLGINDLEGVRKGRIVPESSKLKTRTKVQKQSLTSAEDQIAVRKTEPRVRKAKDHLLVFPYTEIWNKIRMNAFLNLNVKDKFENFGKY